MSTFLSVSAVHVTGEWQFQLCSYSLSVISTIYFDTRPPKGVLSRSVIVLPLVTAYIWFASTPQYGNLYIDTFFFLNYYLREWPHCGWNYQDYDWGPFLSWCSQRYNMVLRIIKKKRSSFMQENHDALSKHLVFTRINMKVNSSVQSQNKIYWACIVLMYGFSL